MTLKCGNFICERKPLHHCGVCGQHEIDGIQIALDLEDGVGFACIDCLTRALRLPTTDAAERLRELIIELEQELSQCRFPNAALMRRLRHEAGTL